VSHQPCGMAEEIRWLEQKALTGLRQGDNGRRATSLGQLSLELRRLRSFHVENCELCGEEQWIA
jgi:hypothetical protein